MNLVKKKKTNNLVQAVCDVSGYSKQEILTSTNHSVTPWARLGMYLAKKHGGKTFDESAKMIGRHFTSGWLSVKKVEESLDKQSVNHALEEIKSLVSKLDSFDNEA